MTKILANTLIDLLNEYRETDATMKVTLNSDYYLEFNTTTAEPVLDDNILKINCNGTLTYFNILDVHLIEIQKNIKIDVKLTQIKENKE